jgi:hypothetical protein
LKEALRLNPEYEKQTEVITLQKRLGATKE